MIIYNYNEILESYKFVYNVLQFSSTRNDILNDNGEIT